MAELSRLPHDPDYLARLGAAVYAFAFMEFGVIDLILDLDPFTQSQSEAMAGTSGRRRDRLIALLADRPEADRAVGQRFAQLVDRRNDIIHAYVGHDPGVGPRLLRRAPGRQEVWFVSDEVLEQFVADCEAFSKTVTALHRRLEAEP